MQMVSSCAKPILCNQDLRASVIDSHKENIDNLVREGHSPYCFDKTGYSLLSHAVDNNDLETIKYLFDSGAEIPNEQDPDGSTLLHTALKNNNIQIVKFLLDHGANRKILDSSGHNILQIAVLNGNLNLTKFLIDSGSNINTLSKKEETLLHFAIRSRSIELAKFLLYRNEIEINAKDIQGNTAISATIYNYEIVKLFIKNGADIFLKNNNKQSLLHLAVKDNNTEFVKYLLAKGLAPLDVDSKVITPIFIAIRDKKEELIQIFTDKIGDINDPEINNGLLKSPFIEYVREKLLLSKARWKNLLSKKKLMLQGVFFRDNVMDKNIISASETELLRYSIISNKSDLIELLLLADVDININDKYGSSPLHYAVIRDNMDLVRILLNMGVNINIEDNDGMTPLHIASFLGRYKIAALLLDKGARVNKKRVDGKTPIELAMYSSYFQGDYYKDIKKYNDVNVFQLDGVGYSYNNIPYHHYYKNNIGYNSHYSSEVIDTVMVLLGRGATIDNDVENYDHILHYIIISNKEELLENFINDTNVNFANHRGRTPLHLAAGLGRYKMVKKLLMNEADPNLQTVEGSTTLHMVVRNIKKYTKDNNFLEKFKNTVQILVNYGADPNIKDNDNKTPIDWAESLGTIRNVNLKEIIENTPPLP